MLPEFLGILEHIYIVIENGHFGSFIYSCWASLLVFFLCVCVAFGVRMMNGYWLLVVTRESGIYESYERCILRD